MTTQANKQLLLKFYEVFNGNPKPEELLRQYISDETLIEHALASEAAFPLYRIDPIEMIAEGDLVSVRATWSGTHRGMFMGIPGTGKSFSTPIFVTYRFAGGKAVDHWMILDSVDLLRQLDISQVQEQGG
jgi:predicted ester cyclase